MRQEDFLVTTTIKNRSRKIVWNSLKPLVLDHPPKWRLERSSSGIQLRPFGEDLSEEDKRPVQITDVVKRGGKVRVPSPVSDEQDRAITVSIQPLQPIKPAFHPANLAAGVLDDKLPGQLFLFWGSRFFLLGFQPLGNSFTGSIGNENFFKISKTNSGYTLVALKSGIKFKHPKEARKDILVGVPMILSDKQFWVGRIEYGKHWWRVNRVPTPEPLKLGEMAAKEKKDAALFRNALLSVMALFIGFSVVVNILPREKKELAIEKSTAVTIKLPKIIPPQEKKPEEKKPEQKKEPPKLPEKKKAPPKEKPAAKKPPKEPPKPVVAPPPPPPPPKVVQPPVEAKPDPAAEAAKAKAQLAEKLSFLSKNPSKAVANIKNDKVTSKYNSAGNVENLKDANSSVLSNITNSKKIEGPIETKNARNIQSDLELSGKGKALNDVQGKVSMGELYDPNGTANLGNSIGTKGMQLSGSGTISEAEIEKALQKYLTKFQYCYEKALLGNSTLGGLVLMQWTISTEGAASEVQTVRSELNAPALHKCLGDQILKITFPAAKGGSVSIKYPFRFSSSTL